MPLKLPPATTRCLRRMEYQMCYRRELTYLAITVLPWLGIYALYQLALSTAG